jgi:gamma-glutamylaminecyclotransferase
MPHAVFVFGTLKTGFPNFATNAGTRVPGRFVTCLPYPLYLVGERHSPWMVHAPGEGSPVHGEVFEVEDTTLAAMDSLERVDAEDGYRRVAIEVRGEDGAVRTVFAYLKEPRHLRVDEVRLGPLDEYTTAHAGLYRARV